MIDIWLILTCSVMYLIGTYIISTAIVKHALAKINLRLYSNKNKYSVQNYYNTNSETWGFVIVGEGGRLTKSNSKTQFFKDIESAEAALINYNKYGI